MLLCGSCNRSKSWTCEHCPNWTAKDTQVCGTCYWAYPQNYSHVATVQMRRADVIWVGEEVVLYEQLAALARASEMSVAEFLKRVFRESGN